MNKIFLASIATSLLFLSSYASANKTEDTGTALLVAIPAIALSTTLKRNDSNGTKQFAKSLGATMLVTVALKSVTNKARPDGSGNDSFPSGHTSVSFMGASYIHERYGLRSAILPYIGATYVGYSRVHADKHDTADVLAGAAIGILSSRYFTTPYKNLSIMPLVDSDTISIGLVKHW